MTLFLSVPLLQHSMGQIIKSLTSHCHSVSLSVNTPTAAILMKFCTVIRGPKSKIEFVWDKNLITPSPILLQIFKKFALRLMGTSKRYNSIPVKDNCALFAPTPYFWARAIRRCR